MQRIKYYPSQPYSADELEHIRIHTMLDNHEKWSMNALWGFILYFTCLAIATGVAIYVYWPF